MTPTQISQVQLQTGNIVVKDQLPALVIGRLVIATVLSKPKDGMVLVSMFGKQILVETTMELAKGQVLKLKVQDLHPKVVLKPAEAPTSPKAAAAGSLSTMIEQLVGKLGDTPLKAFNINRILEDHITGKPVDAATAQFAAALIDEAAKYPQALAFLLIPIVQEQSQGRAKVVIEADPEQGYMITFDMETDHMGVIGCTARVGATIDVEIRTGSEALADLFRSHLPELHVALSALGTVKRLDVVMRRMPQAGVDMLV